MFCVEYVKVHCIEDFGFVGTFDYDFVVVPAFLGDRKIRMNSGTRPEGLAASFWVREEKECVLWLAALFNGPSVFESLNCACADWR